MKKLLLGVIFCAGCYGYAQDNNAEITTNETTSKSTNLYNKWSIDLGGGLHKPIRPFADGYQTGTLSPWQASLGVRYMFSESFGLRIDGGYNKIENSDNSKKFETNYYRTDIEGVVNLGSIAGFRTFSNRFNILLHAGVGASFIYPDYNEDVVALAMGKTPEYQDDTMINFIGGITPQIRLGRQIAFFLDFSAVGHLKQGVNFDGTEATGSRGFDGYMINTSAGLNIYLGGASRHADWYSSLEDLKKKVEKNEKRINEAEQTLEAIEEEIAKNEEDRDGNGVPDRIEQGLDKKYLTKDDFEKEFDNAMKNQDNAALYKELIEIGYTNVYFKSNSSDPENFDAINFLRVYMLQNSEVKAEIIGYADGSGQAKYNNWLSEKRAKRVYDILISSGISTDRLSYRGAGEENTINQDSVDSRRLSRRVEFRLIE